MWLYQSWECLLLLSQIFLRELHGSSSDTSYVILFRIIKMALVIFIFLLIRLRIVVNIFYFVAIFVASDQAARIVI